jgi:hypothetical protein
MKGCAVFKTVEFYGVELMSNIVLVLKKPSLHSIEKRVCCCYEIPMLSYLYLNIGRVLQNKTKSRRTFCWFQIFNLENTGPTYLKRGNPSIHPCCSDSSDL